MREGGEGCRVSEYSCAQGAQINYGDLNLYLTYAKLKRGGDLSGNDGEDPGKKDSAASKPRKVN
jgi:hypothetical protein